MRRSSPCPQRLLAFALLAGFSVTAPTTVRAAGVIDIIVTTPGAQLFLNGVQQGLMPATEGVHREFVVPAGKYRVELRLPTRNSFYQMRSQLDIMVEDNLASPVRLTAPVPEILPDAPERVTRTVAGLMRDMVVIPSGTFEMGTEEVGAVSESEMPHHTVRIAEPFRLSRNEVTFDQWDACIADDGCTTVPKDEGMGRGQQPVRNVSWDDTQQFVTWMSRRTGIRFRLPSEAEWEYAARGRDGQAGPTSNDATLLRRFAWFDTDAPHPVGTREANSLGLHDMQGNVAEWVQDCWHDNFQGAPNDGSAWLSGRCRARVVKGGDWNDFAWYLRPAQRSGVMQRNTYNYIGFRVLAQP